MTDGPTIDAPHLRELPGTVIGPYKLLQQIGEGGMGIVWMAEQTQPVQRKVALKVIKPGMDSRQVIARFEAERQALAMMDHVSIARVLDAGTTEAGLPYFVMELVHGIPITKYCDDNRLAHHRLGQADEALRCLAEAARWIDEANRAELDDLTRTQPNWGEWHEPVVSQLPLREAVELLGVKEKKN